MDSDVRPTQPPPGPPWADADHPLTVEELDEIAGRLKQFAFEKRGCPGCKGFLDEPKPLRKNVCPVCQSATLVKRPLNQLLCPHCKLGVLGLVKNSPKLAICPTCRRGPLVYKPKGLIKGLLSAEQIATCQVCDAHFEVRGGKMTWMEREEEPQRDFEEWRILSGRSTQIWRCGDCNAQYDLEATGQWTQIVPDPLRGYRTLYPTEWARVALGLPADAGNTVCPSCNSDFDIEGSTITLLKSPREGTRFVDQYLHNTMTLEEARWLGVGKTSVHPGLLCDNCRTEFDKDEQYLRLVKTPNPNLLNYLTQLKTLEDWHRIAQSLPTVDQELEFEESFAEALKDAYRQGYLSVDSEGAVLWKSEASPIGKDRRSNLTITRTDVVYGNLLGKKRQPTDAIVAAWSEEQDIHLRLSGVRDSIGYTIKPIVLTAHLGSGDRDITITAEDLAARLRHELRLPSAA